MRGTISRNTSNTLHDVTKEASGMAEVPYGVKTCVDKILDEVEKEIPYPPKKLTRKRALTRKIGLEIRERRLRRQERSISTAREK